MSERNNIAAIVNAFGLYGATEEERAHVEEALSMRGKRKGFLKAQCPRSDLMSAAAWQAIVANSNPYKFRPGILILGSQRQKDLFNKVNGFCELLESSGVNLGALDYDRYQLSQIGAW